MKPEEKESILTAINLLTEMIERANQNDTYVVTHGDFLYYTMAEVRDKLKQSISSKPF